MVTYGIIAGIDSVAKTRKALANMADINTLVVNGDLSVNIHSNNVQEHLEELMELFGGLPHPVVIQPGLQDEFNTYSQAIQYAKVRKYSNIYDTTINTTSDNINSKRSDKQKGIVFFIPGVESPSSDFRIGNFQGRSGTFYRAKGGLPSRQNKDRELFWYTNIKYRILTNMQLYKVKDPTNILLITPQAPEFSLPQGIDAQMFNKNPYLPDTINLAQQNSHFYKQFLKNNKVNKHKLPLRHAGSKFLRSIYQQYCISKSICSSPSINSQSCVHSVYIYKDATSSLPENIKSYNEVNVKEHEYTHTGHYNSGRIEHNQAGKVYFSDELMFHENIDLRKALRAQPYKR